MNLPSIYVIKKKCEQNKKNENESKMKCTRQIGTRTILMSRQMQTVSQKFLLVIHFF